MTHLSPNLTEEQSVNFIGDPFYLKDNLTHAAHLVPAITTFYTQNSSWD